MSTSVVQHDVEAFYTTVPMTSLLAGTMTRHHVVYSTDGASTLETRAPLKFHSTQTH